jgi:8-oxo-dGTP pyrophosphatase MutT (NUDIX family)
MAVPEYVLRLREKIGQDLLWLQAVIMIVYDDDGRVLLGRRTDTGRWALPSGILEPGEQPADGAAREVLEETGVVMAVDRLVHVEAGDPGVCPNGDRVQFLTMTYVGYAIGGEACVNDDESTEVGWYALDALPDLPMRHARCLADALGVPGERYREPAQRIAASEAA